MIVPQYFKFSLDTLLGREFEGVQLSGGEWQKIALARGFLKKSHFIILHEPNASVYRYNTLHSIFVYAFYYV
ncbi:MAG: ATP-binding cassette domain-containing protein [Lachnospiraceae bacterium]